MDDHAVIRKSRVLICLMGVFTDLLEPLRYKVECLDVRDRLSVISFDEMSIQCCEDYDKNKKEFFGYCSIGNKESLGTHLLAVVLRGIRSPVPITYTVHHPINTSFSPYIIAGDCL